MLAGTLAAWIEALCADRVWDERIDLPRFRKAFRVLMTTCDRWPTPKKFLDAMPSSVVPFTARPRIEHDATREARVRSFKEIRRTLRIPEPDDEPEPPRAA